MGKSGRPGKIWEICMETEGSETENTGKTGLVILCQWKRLRPGWEVRTSPWNWCFAHWPQPWPQRVALPFRWSFSRLRLGFHMISHIWHIEKSLLSQWNRHRNCIISGDPPFWDKAISGVMLRLIQKNRPWLLNIASYSKLHTVPYCTILYPESRRTIYICWSKRSLTLLQVEMMLKKCTPLWREATLHCTALQYTTLHYTPHYTKLHYTIHQTTLHQTTPTTTTTTTITAATATATTTATITITTTTLHQTTLHYNYNCTYTYTCNCTTRHQIRTTLRYNYLVHLDKDYCCPKSWLYMIVYHLPLGQE